ncbi:DUF397 domain-containing protein [Kitasatospora xanthocidica]|uniref:DUF397 domain-containing protein n=1 Tax=Kitasatospora xanthocidica TaxID=83382 RepID=UPI0036E068F8
MELAWFKSSYSSNEGAQCVEIAWRKSSHCSDKDTACLEIAEATEAVLVRDSKDKSGPHLTFTPPAWQAFVTFATTTEA